MMILEAGKPLGITLPGEGVFLEADESGYMMVLNYLAPTQEEINDVAAEQPFEIRETMMDGALWIVAKFGSQPWIDAPFSPHLSKAWDKLEMPEEENTGHALTVVMTDARSGIVKAIRMIGLGHRFSVQMLKDIRELAALDFDRSVYDASINRTMSMYQTKDIVKLARNYFKLR